MAAANLNSKLDSSVPTMLGIIVDCNPIAWATSAVEAPIPFVQAIEHILVFINTFLIMNRHNRLVVIGSCLGESVYLYPKLPSASHNSTDSELHYPTVRQEIEESIRERIMPKIRSASLDLARAGSQLSGSVITTTCYMNKVVSEFLSRQVFEQRVLIVSPANDTAAHFISLMNSAFTLQKLGMTLDACLLNQPIDSSHLQQACEITRGVYTRPKHPMGLINYLLGVHILDSTARSNFEMPQNRAIDYKATCFCHSKAVDLGFICSACLAVYCESVSSCATCGNSFRSP